ncbi:MAG: four helix bundle protein [Gemmatimonadales bacterium]
MMPYQRLTAWRAAHELVIEAYRATANFPKTELYGLTSQLRRASFSIAANIAEGVAKRGGGEFGRFLDIAIGSLSEVSYVTLLASELGYLDRDAARNLEGKRMQPAKLVWGLYKKTRRRSLVGRRGS